jgi:hypothetical protein
MGMASVFYDVLNYLVIDSCIHPSGYSERACASKHVKHATQNDFFSHTKETFLFNMKGIQPKCRVTSIIND